MAAQELAERMVEHLMAGDSYSHWLGITVVNVSPGACVLQLTVRDEMNNGFHIAHGGITYALADSALAFASNTHGTRAVSIETSISHTKPVMTGDVLTATAKELNLSNRLGLYLVSITKQDGSSVAEFKGTTYRTGKLWEF